MLKFMTDVQKLERVTFKLINKQIILKGECKKCNE